MNRIMVKYTSRKGNVGSMLQIFNDIKGYSCEKIGMNFFGKDADLMLELLKNVDYSKTKDCVSYGIYIDEEEYINEKGND